MELAHIEFSTSSRRDFLRAGFVVTEFGRTTPKINNERAGRDHWKEASTMLIAGGKVNPGVVVGKTNYQGHIVSGPHIKARNGGVVNTIIDAATEED